MNPRPSHSRPVLSWRLRSLEVRLALLMLLLPAPLAGCGATQRLPDDDDDASIDDDDAAPGDDDTSVDDDDTSVDDDDTSVDDDDASLPPSCDPTSCASGCCDADQNCVAYADQGTAVCGAGGSTCTDCGGLDPYLALTCEPSLHACSSGLPRDALFVGQLIPEAMAPGDVAEISVTMLNIGTQPWTEATSHRLGSQNPQDNGSWGTGRVALDAAATIAPGEQAIFTFDVVAPASIGFYNSRWRMLQEQVEWFGEFSDNVAVMVSTDTIAVCEPARALANAGVDASATLQACIDAAPANTVVELPAGVYSLDQPLVISVAGIILRTEGKTPDMARCTLVAHDCAELRPSVAFAAAGGFLVVQATGTIVHHLVLDGNKAARTPTWSGQQCAAYSNSHGYNMRLICSHCGLVGSVTRDALCGTGCEVTGVGEAVVLDRNHVAYNGVHNVEGLWADGVTVHDYSGSTFTANEFIDNTDIDLIFGGCQDCVIQDNTLVHTTAFEGAAFAALMLHAWPSTSGDFTGSDTSWNSIDCGADRQCGIGLYLGSDAWYITDVFGGSVHDNEVLSAQQGVLIDDVHDMAVWDNPVLSTSASTVASCGTLAAGAYSIGTRSVAVDTSRDSLGTVWVPVDWDLCIPNWWTQ